jgi:hypothetical protein
LHAENLPPNRADGKQFPPGTTPTRRQNNLPLPRGLSILRGSFNRKIILL